MHKPDFAAQRRHFIFTEDHEQLRESIRRFVVKELQPHPDRAQRPERCSCGGLEPLRRATQGPRRILAVGPAAAASSGHASLW
jgi:hypothetical protein